MNDYATQDFLDEVDGNPVVDICKDVLCVVGACTVFTACYIALLEVVIIYSLRY